MKVRIRELLKERGMTSAQLAEKSDSDQRTINSLVTRASFTVGSLSRYAAQLNVPTWELIHDCGASARGHEPADGVWTTNPIRELRIEALMQEQHVSRAELARRMGVSNASVTMMMKRGSDKLSSVVIEKLMNALGVPVWQLFVSEEEYYGEVARRRGCTADDVRLQMKGERKEALRGVVSDLAPLMNDEPGIMDPVLLADGEQAEERMGLDDPGLMVVGDGKYRYGQYIVTLKDGAVTVSMLAV